MTPQPLLQKAMFGKPVWHPIPCFVGPVGKLSPDLHCWPLPHHLQVWGLLEPQLLELLSAAPQLLLWCPGKLRVGYPQVQGMTSGMRI